MTEQFKKQQTIRGVCKQCNKEFFYVFSKKTRSYCQKSCHHESLRNSYKEEGIPIKQYKAPRIMSARSFTYNRLPLHLGIAAVIGIIMVFLFQSFIYLMH